MLHRNATVRIKRLITQSGNNIYWVVGDLSLRKKHVALLAWKGVKT